MTLSDYEIETINRLGSVIRRDAARLSVYGTYYEGLQHLEHLGIAVPQELRDFVVIVNWPRIVADTLEERIDLEGFRLPGTHRRHEELWSIWQTNNLDEESQLAHLDALIYGRSFVCVGSNEDDPRTPIVTVESPMEMTVEISPRTRRVERALRFFRDSDPGGLVVDRAVLYLPNETVWAERRYTGPSRGGWIETGRDEHNLGRVPVVPIVNRARTANRYGVPEIQDVIQLTDAAARALTLAQLATEILSVPQRAVLGASEEDFVDADGKILPKWQAYFGAIWSLENEDAKLHQFSAADLGNFDKILTTYAVQVSSVSGLPLRYFGQNLANPPSEGAIVADESRLIKKAERRHRAWGGSWEEVARLIKLIRDGSLPDEWHQIESIWRNPATPTEAQTADAVVKKVQAGILPIEAAWEDLGYTPTRIEELRAMREADLQATDVLARQINAYRSGIGTEPAADEEPLTAGAE